MVGFLTRELSLADDGGLKLVNLNECIRITCPCYVYPLISQFYIVKMGFIGVNIFL